MGGSGNVLQMAVQAEVMFSICVMRRARDEYGRSSCNEISQNKGMELCISCLEGRVAIHSGPSSESRDRAKRAWTAISGASAANWEGTSVALRSTFMGTCTRISPVYYRLASTWLFEGSDIPYSFYFTSKFLFATSPRPFSGNRKGETSLITTPWFTAHFVNSWCTCMSMLAL